MKEMNGCEKDSILGERWIIEQYRLKRCPIKEVTQEGLEYLEAYKFYKNGVLPIAGGWLNQTQSFTEAVMLIDAEIIKIKGMMNKERKNG